MTPQNLKTAGLEPKRPRAWRVVWPTVRPPKRCTRVGGDTGSTGEVKDGEQDRA